jgi:type I restriction enzyme R subunit
LKQAQPEPVNISEVMADIGALLDLSITGVSMPKGAKLLDLSKIDFDALRSKLAKQSTRTLISKC